MGQVVTKKGIEMILGAYFNNTWPSGNKNHTLKLYTNDHEPLETDGAGAFTEASGGGYAAKTLANGSWTVESANTPRDVIYAVQTFTFTGALDGGATIYGYFVVDSDGNLITAEKLGAPNTPAVAGDHVDITPRVQGSKGTPS